MQTYALTEKQQLAVELLSEGLSKKAIAERVGVTDRTIRNWVKLPQVRSAIRVDSIKATEAIFIKVTEMMPELIEILQGIATDDLTTTKDRMSAIKLLKEFQSDGYNNAVDEEMQGVLDFVENQRQLHRTTQEVDVRVVESLPEAE